jgi:flagellar biosynthesis protein FlhF
MKIKTIRAKNFREALSLVKKELGSDAVILSSEDKKGIRSYVEVTAAIDYDVQDNVSEYQGAATCRDNVAPAHQPNQHMAGDSGSGEIVNLKHDIKELREYIESMKNSGFELKMSEERKRIFNYLKGKSIQEELALKLVERTAAIEDLETAMTHDLKLSAASADMPVKEKGKIKMLIGPTGTGKTTTVAKLASNAIREGKKVAMISIDTFKIGAAEQIRIYSRMIGIPLDIVANRESFKKSIDRFSDRDLILVDTSGQNPGDVEYINSLNRIYETGMPVETQLLLSASSDCSFLMDMHKYYKSFPIDYMAFTKTDEAVKLGSLYNLCCQYKKPVSYITTGQRVPGNIEFVDSRKLTNIILRTGCA